MSYTQKQLTDLKDAYSSGVLKIRNGDDWLEYSTMREMRIAIADIENELAAQSSGGRPSGTRLVSVSRGFRR